MKESQLQQVRHTPRKALYLLARYIIHICLDHKLTWMVLLSLQCCSLITTHSGIIIKDSFLLAEEDDPMTPVVPAFWLATTWGVIGRGFVRTHPAPALPLWVSESATEGLVYRKHEPDEGRCPIRDLAANQTSFRVTLQLVTDLCELTSLALQIIMRVLTLS